MVKVIITMRENSAFELGKFTTMWLDLLAMSGCSYAVALGRSCEPFGVNDFAPDIPWPCGCLNKRPLQGIDGRPVRIKLLLARRERGWLAHMGTVRGSCGQ